EGGTEPWIRVEKFEHAVTLVVSVADIEDSFVTDSFHQIHRVGLDCGTGKAYSQRRHACIHGGLMKLSSGKTEHAVRILIKVSVKHPHARILAGNVLLNHHRGIGHVFHGRISVDQFLLGPDDGHLAPRTSGNADVVASLQHDGKLSCFAEIENI